MLEFPFLDFSYNNVRIISLAKYTSFKKLLIQVIILLALV